jgi:hypothetical protein
VKFNFVLVGYLSLFKGRRQTKRMGVKNEMGILLLCFFLLFNTGIATNPTGCTSDESDSSVTHYPLKRTSSI